jgi:hypothetical protein
MKVYVLSWHDWEDSLIEGVYVSEAAAEQGKARALAKDKASAYEDYRIEGHEVED